MQGLGGEFNILFVFAKMMMLQGGLPKERQGWCVIVFS
jgi:hypothetical protein